MQRPLHGLILAAGASTRMGRVKALLPLPEGGCFVGALVQAFAQADLASVWVVVGAHPEVAAAVPAPGRVVVAEGWAAGMRASLRAGLLACPPGDVLLTHVDRPRVAPETLRALAAAPPGRAAVPVCEGRAGHPVRLPAGLRARLLVQDDVPLRALLDGATPVPVVDPGVLLNVNTLADWRALWGRGRCEGWSA